MSQSNELNKKLWIETFLGKVRLNVLKKMNVKFDKLKKLIVFFLHFQPIMKLLLLVQNSKNFKTPLDPFRPI